MACSIMLMPRWCSPVLLAVCTRACLPYASPWRRRPDTCAARPPISHNSCAQRGGADGRLNSSDFDAALARVHKRSSHEEALQFLKWKSHLSALP